jgi:GTPase SAR1 family protein
MNEFSDHQKIKIKIGLLGDQGVGKSTFINNFISSIGENNLVQSKLNI